MAKIIITIAKEVFSLAKQAKAFKLPDKVNVSYVGMAELIVI